MSTEPREAVKLQSEVPLLLAAKGVPMSRVETAIELLDDSKTVWVVEEGSMDVFGVRVEDGKSVGSWTFLCRSVAGGAFPGGLDAETGYGFLGRLTPGSVVSRVSREAFEDLGAEVPATVADAFDDDLGEIAGTVQTELPPRDFRPLDPPAVAELEEGVTGRPVDGNVWVTVESGSALLHSGGGTRMLEPGAEAFLSPSDWVVGEGAVRLRTARTAELLANRTLGPRLDAYLGHLREAFATQRASQSEQEKERTRERARRDVQLVDFATRRFSAVLSPREAERHRLAMLDPAVAVATLVGDVQGITIRPPTRSELGRRTDAIAAIARASRFRTRTVRLEAVWWKEDAGPMVGFLKGSNTPVALLKVRGGYMLDDPTNDRQVRVDEEVAKELQAEARQFYTPLPERPITGLELVRFGARGLRSEVLVLIACGLVVAVLGLLTPIMTGKILGSLVPRAATGTIDQYVIILLVAAAAAAVLSMIQNLAALRIEGRVDLSAQSGIWDRLMSLPVRFFRQYSIGELSSAALGVNGIRDALSGIAVQAVLAFVFGIVNLGLMLYYDIGLGIIGLLIVSVGAGISMWASVLQVRRQRELQKVSNLVNSDVFQLMSGVAKLRVAAAEDRAYSFWAQKFAEMRKLSFTARLIQNRVTAFNAAYIVLAALGLFAYIGLAKSGTFSTATFLTFNVAFLALLGATLQLTGTGITVLAIVPLFENLKPILTNVPEVDDTKGDPGELAGEVEVAHINFRYAPDGPLVLDDVSWQARPGQFVALVGPSGCGKSTLLRLLLGFESPESGAIFYDGQDLEELDTQAVRRQCGVVLQHGQLFAGDILSNIVGSSLYTIDDAWEAAEMAGLKEDIEQMPMGMNTLLSEGASTLSGGQRQRLMIARALIARPRIVFFDEATSALDNRTQEIVSGSMRRLNATRIVIAHRLSTIQGADLVVVLDRGNVVQMGGFDELIEQEGMFRRLALRQIV
jgi:NHLM bacteriocin system ABC transporter ATP-binding protein